MSNYSAKGFTTKRAERELDSYRWYPRRVPGGKPCTQGFTLIELIVSVGLFAVVMLVATTAFLTLISMDRKARTTNDVVTNLSYAMDTVARSIRTGSRYQCGGIGGGDCWPAGQNSFAFLDTNGCYETVFVSNGQLVVTTQTGTNACTTSTAVPLTDPRVSIPSNGLVFYVRGTAAGVADDTQPRVTFSLHGTMTPDPNSPAVQFSIQTSAEQRLIDL